MMVLKGCPYSNPRSLCMCYSHGKANFADVIKVKDLETGKSKEGEKAEEKEQQTGVKCI